MSEQYFDTKDLDYWFFIKEDAEIWKSLKLHVEGVLTEKRDMRGMEQESEPKRIQSFTTYHKYLTKKETAEKLQELERMMSEAGKIASMRESLRRQIADYIASFEGLSAEELERHFGKFTPNHFELVNEFESGVLNAQDWVTQHPEAWAELIKLWEAKEHERTHSQAVSQ